MGKEKGTANPAEAFFGAKFLEIYKDCKEKGSYDDLWRYGVVYLGNSFYLLANTETSETVAEMWKSGKLPESLVDISGAIRGNGNLDGMAWQISMFLTIQALKLDPDGEDGFKSFANKLGIVDADDLKLFKLKDPRSWWERSGDKLATLLEVLHGAYLPWYGSEEFYQHQRSLQSRE